MLQETTIINTREQAPVYYYALLALTFLVSCYGTNRIVRHLESRTRLGIHTITKAALEN